MARVRRGLLLPDMLGTCGRGGTRIGAQRRNFMAVRTERQHHRFLRGQKTGTDMVDIEQSSGLYTPHIGAPPLGAMVRLRSSSLIAVTGHRPQVGGSGFGGSPASGRGSCTPGCLTGESEERETWTAESLRVAWDGLRPCGLQSFGKQFP